ncbi:MAG: DUF2834 domain-containing protein [Gammaproteobacteria bacterium]|nr:DUF2834 domain-containing protein [Gammaproteobacteria bacterium]
MKTNYAIFCILGIALPYWQFIPWLMENGPDIVLLIKEAAQLRIGAFAWLDVLVSAAVLIMFIMQEGRRLRMTRLWAPILGTCAVGVSLGLPLFLWLREKHLETTARA